MRKKYSGIGLHFYWNTAFRELEYLCTSMKQQYTLSEFSFFLLFEHLSIINSLVRLTIRLPITTNNTSSQTTGHLNSID
jgi:hypothetical protein